MCVYELENVDPKICKHAHPIADGNRHSGHILDGAAFEEDKIWIPGPMCGGSLSVRSWKCLKSEAKKAAEVSAGFLSHFAITTDKVIDPESVTSYRESMRFMTDDDLWHGGYFKGVWE